MHCCGSNPPFFPRRYRADTADIDALVAYIEAGPPPSSHVARDTGGRVGAGTSGAPRASELATGADSPTTKAKLKKKKKKAEKKAAAATVGQDAPAVSRGCVAPAAAAGVDVEPLPAVPVSRDAAGGSAAPTAALPPAAPVVQPRAAVVVGAGKLLELRHQLSLRHRRAVVTCSPSGGKAVITPGGNIVHLDAAEWVFNEANFEEDEELVSVLLPAEALCVCPVLSSYTCGVNVFLVSLQDKEVDEFRRRLQLPT